MHTIITQKNEFQIKLDILNMFHNMSIKKCCSMSKLVTITIDVMYMIWGRL